MLISKCYRIKNLHQFHGILSKRQLWQFLTLKIHGFVLESAKCSNYIIHFICSQNYEMGFSFTFFRLFLFLNQTDKSFQICLTDIVYGKTEKLYLPPQDDKNDSYISYILRSIWFHNAFPNVYVY